MASVSLLQRVWKTVDVFGVEELTESGVDCTSDPHVVETIEVNEGKCLVTDNDISPVFSTVLHVEVGAVIISIFVTVV